MRKIIIGQNLNSGMAVLGFLLGFAALLLVLTGPAHARQHVEFGGSCNGTSECVGNLSCHVGSLQWNLEPEKTCECPEPGDGSYSEGTNPENNDRRPLCYGRGLPCERHWDPEHGAFADCLPHELSEFGQFDSLIITPIVESRGRSDLSWHNKPPPLHAAGQTPFGGVCQTRLRESGWSGINGDTHH